MPQSLFLTPIDTVAFRKLDRDEQTIHGDDTISRHSMGDRFKTVGYVGVREGGRGGGGLVFSVIVFPRSRCKTITTSAIHRDTAIKDFPIGSAVFISP
jgi:hypothetical protein